MLGRAGRRASGPNSDRNGDSMSGLGGSTGRLEPLLAEAVAVRVGRTVAVADIRVYHAETREAPVATGKGVYSIKVPRSQSVKQ